MVFHSYRNYSDKCQVNDSNILILQTIAVLVCSRFPATGMFLQWGCWLMTIIWFLSVLSVGKMENPVWCGEWCQCVLIPPSQGWSPAVVTVTLQSVTLKCLPYTCFFGGGFFFVFFFLIEDVFLKWQLIRSSEEPSLYADSFLGQGTVNTLTETCHLEIL